MQKVVIIFIVFTITISCSLTRKKVDKGSKDPIANSSNTTLNKVIEQNITQTSFFIIKADIEIISENERKEFVASIKFSKPDKYLVSLKSKAGIEAARIFLTNDTILINDRFNRIQYYGSPGKFYEKYGITNDLLLLILGDFKNIECVNSNLSICKNDKLIITCSYRSTEIIYQIDCIKNKVDNLKLTNGDGKGELTISFSGFKKRNNILFPQQISIAGIQAINMMNIVIRKVEFPWEGVVDFLPGNKYEKIEIL